MSERPLRDVPWFKVYPASDLSKIAFFGLGVGERGLLGSMQRAYWVEGSLPCDPRLLSRVVRLDEAEVLANLTPGVLAYFRPGESDGSLQCPDLADQMSGFMERTLN